MKTDLCIITGYTPDSKWQEVATITVPTMQEYADSWGYDFKAYTEGFDKSRHPAWSKVLFVKETLPNYEWILWIDADAAITNQTVDVDKFLMSDADILVTKDVDTCVLNSGIFFIRRCDFSFWLLDEMWSKNEWADKPMYEQSALVEVYLEGKVGNHLAQYDMREFGGFCDWPEAVGHERCSMEHLQWHVGDFIAHSSYLHHKDRLRILKEVVGLTVRL